MKQIEIPYAPDYYYCVRNGKETSCVVLGRGYGDYDHERRSAPQYYVGALDGEWADYVDWVQTPFERDVEWITNQMPIPLMIGNSSFSPKFSAACCDSLRDDPRLFTDQQLALLAGHGYGAALRHRAQKELDARLDEIELKIELRREQ